MLIKFSANWALFSVTGLTLSRSLALSVCVSHSLCSGSIEQ